MSGSLIKLDSRHKSPAGAVISATKIRAGNYKRAINNMLISRDARARAREILGWLERDRESRSLAVSVYYKKELTSDRRLLRD